MTKLKLIAFDVTNCLILFKKSVGMEYAQIGGLYNAAIKPADEARLTQAFNAQIAAMSKLYPNYGTTQGMSSYQWWAMLVQRTFRNAGFQENTLPDPTLKQISAHLYKHFGTTNCWSLRSGTKECLTGIKSIHPHMRLGVISNSDERLSKILTGFGIYHYFDFVLISAIAKVRKPDPRIFEMALEKANLTKPEEALFVGNTVHKDYLGAKKCGWHAILLRTHGIEQEDLSLVKKTDIIDSLDEIMKHDLLKV